ncbi:cytochrome P450 [Cubamyces lactineus]|nr:cytochrome P450 [Cubamyces lactineus]
MSLVDFWPAWGCCCFALVLCSAWLYLSHIRNPLLRLPGPSSHNLFGYAKDFWTSDPTELHEEWVQVYGRTMSYRVLSDICLYTVDLKALSHIISHDSAYQKPYKVRTFIAEMLGTGILLSEGERHRQQKRIVNPAFGPVQIRSFHGLFLDKALQLRDVLSALVSRDTGSASVDMYTWMHRFALDVICKAAFGCDISTLDVKQERNSLCDAFRLVSQSVTRLSLFPMLRFFFPVLRIFPDEQTRRFRVARKTMREFAMQAIQRKRAIMPQSPDRKQLRRRTGDILSLLVEANAGTYLLEEQRISDETMIDECCTFLVAGHETTTTTLSWLFFEIAAHPDVQNKLRDEILSVGTDRPSLDELASLHYLDCVVRETIRLHPSIPSSLRVAVEDDSIPLGSPVSVREEIIDRVSVCKGTPIVIPILAVNRDKASWGEDAFEFKPTRWDNLPDAVVGIPGIWGHSLTFMGGQHACIGYRFALNEIKAVVFVLMRAFAFSLAVPSEDIGASATLLTRPMRVSDPDGGPQLPVLIKPLSLD